MRRNLHTRRFLNESDYDTKDLMDAITEGVTTLKLGYKKDEEVFMLKGLTQLISGSCEFLCNLDETEPGELGLTGHQAVNIKKSLNKLDRILKQYI